MSVHISDVLDYLDTHPVCCCAEGVDSVMELLHDAYAAHNSIDNEEIRGQFQKLRGITKMLTTEEFDQLFSCVCDLCAEHEVLAFSHGILVGMHFMTEVNNLP